jgi:cold shock CspA family protein
VVIAVAVGTVVRFDTVKGYGFVTPETGAEDVFIHVNDLLFDKRDAVAGTRVEFVLEEGEKGPKASRIRLLAAGGSSRATPTAAADDDELCDILLAKEFLAEVTESLLTCSQITGVQIVEIRQQMLRLARSHGWIETVDHG